MKRHAIETTFSCDKCSEQFTDESALNEHIQEHDEKSALICQNCNKTFDTEKRKKQHEKKCERKLS